MNQVLATILVCAATTAEADCTRDSALDVLRTPVPSLFACMMAGQGRTARERLLDEGRYLKIHCGDRSGTR